MNSRILLFDYLRFPLTILVIFTHWRGSADYQATYVLDFIMSPLGGVVSVPLFFIISGYFFFKNFSRKTILAKYISRCKSILIPYFVWNILYIVFKSCCLHENILVFFASHGYWKAFWGEEPYGFPALFPFWYLRDMIFLFAFSPILLMLIRCTKGWILMLLLIVHCIWDYFPGIFILKPISLFFFSIGGYLSERKVTIEQAIDRTARVANWTIIPLAIVYYSHLDNSLCSFISKLFPLVSVIVVIHAASKTLTKATRAFIKLSRASFLVYGAHYFVIPYCYKLYAVSDVLLWKLVIYLIVPFIIYFSCYIIHVIMNRYLRIFCILLTGGR